MTIICRLAIVGVCVIVILYIGNTQISILLLCFLYLFVEFVITMSEYNFVKPKKEERKKDRKKVGGGGGEEKERYTLEMVLMHYFY